MIESFTFISSNVSLLQKVQQIKW